MNAWGAIVIAIGAGVMWWSVKHAGGVGNLLGNTVTNAAKTAAKGANTVVTTPDPLVNGLVGGPLISWLEHNL